MGKNGRSIFGTLLRTCALKLLVVSHPCVTPINQQFFSTVEELTGWDITLLVPQKWKSEYVKIDTIERWPKFRGEIRTVPIWKSGSIPLHIYRSFLISQIRQIQPNVIYVHNEPYAVATGQFQIANRLSVRCPIGYYSAQNIVKRYPLPFRWLEKWVLRSSDFAFPVSDTVDNVLKKKGAVHTTVLPLAIDPELYRPKSDFEEYPDALRGDKDIPIIGYVGRICKEKGVGTLLKALQMLKATKWKAVFIGAGPMERDVDDAADTGSKEKKVIRLDYVPHHDVPGYLAAMDLLIIPSETQPNWKEQFGRVIIEALACGTPVVGSDSGEIPNLIDSTGGGVTFPEGNASELASCIDQLLEDKPKLRSYAEHGRRTVLSRYAIRQCAKIFSDTIDNCVRRTCEKR